MKLARSGAMLTTMTTKQYLMQIKHSESKVKRFEDQLATIRAEMSGLKSPAYDSDRVQTSNNDDRLSQLVIRCQDVEIQYIEEISKLVALRTKIIMEIESLCNESHKQVLYLRYVKHERWEGIAAEMNFSLRRIYQIHGRALQEFGKRFHLISL